jgi:hypothetical protein
LVATIRAYRTGWAISLPLIELAPERHDEEIELSAEASVLAEMKHIQ